MKITPTHTIKVLTFYMCVAAAAPLLLSGCMSYESARHTRLTREYLTADLEDQIMFNLIRAKNGLPFVHYDISSIQSQVGQSLKPGISGNRSAATSGFLPNFDPTDALRTITRGVSPSLSADRNANQTINASPVYADPKIYAAYVEFLNTGVPKQPGTKKKPIPPATKVTVKDSSTTSPQIVAVEAKTKADGANDGTTTKTLPPVTTTSNESEFSYELRPPTEALDLEIRAFNDDVKSVVKTSAKPPEAIYVKNTLKKWEGSYYYIPKHYISQFSKLCLATTARGDVGGSSGTAVPNLSKGVSPAERALQQLQIDSTNQLNFLRSRD